MGNGILLVILTAMAPVSELRGAIPLGLGLGMDPMSVILSSIIFNILIFFPIYFGLKLFYDRFLHRFKFVRSVIERSHKRGRPYIDKYGVIGLALFIGIPLPITGVWTGTIVAWFLDLDWKKSLLAVIVGVIISAAIVSAISLGVLNFI